MTSRDAIRWLTSCRAAWLANRTRIRGACHHRAGLAVVATMQGPWFGHGCSAFSRRIPRVVSRFTWIAAAIAIVAATSGHPAAAATAAWTCSSAAVIAGALPATVNIRVVKVVRVRAATARKHEVDRFRLYTGSGFVIDPSGIIATNKHVIENAAVIEVVFSDGAEARAQLIGAGDLIDLALLKVSASRPLVALRFGDSNALQVGQPVIAVGDPLGIGMSVSTGVVSALGRALMTTPFDDFVQTDAAINPGDSGGPLLDCTGNVIGIDTALISNAKVLGSIGLGFALASNSVKFATHRLLGEESGGPNWIGVHLQDVTAQLGRVFGYFGATGAIVTSVDPNSPAADAALRAGDIVTAANGRELRDASQVMRFVLRQSAGSPVTLSLWRAGRPVDLLIRGRPWPHMKVLHNEVLATAADVVRAESIGLGLHLDSVTASDLGQRTGLIAVPGVRINRVTPGSQAANVGLVAGDVIEQIGEQPARTPESVMARLAHAETPVALLVRGKTGKRWVLLHIGHIDVRDLVATPMRLAHGGLVDSADRRPR